VNIIKDRIGLSLLEIIVALLILSLVMYGLTSLFMVSKRLMYHSGSRITSMEVGKFFFEDANLSVRADIDNCLYNNSKCANNSTTYNGIVYNVTYLTDNVTNATGDNTSLRRVIINVTWNEPK
jgi:hypothetical protein